MKFRKKKKYGIVLPISIIIIIITTILFNKYTNKIEPKLLSIAKYDLDKYTNKAILNTFNEYIIDDNELMNLLVINKNKDNEIISVDYNVENVYQMLHEFTNNIENNFVENEKTTLEYFDDTLTLDNDSFILYYPILLGSNKMFLNNIGPKVPIKINFLSNILTNVSTNIREYGINSLLLEMYVDISIRHKIIAQNVENINFEYRFLISSKIINGKIPSYYGGIISKNSNVVS